MTKEEREYVHAIEEELSHRYVEILVNRIHVKYGSRTMEVIAGILGEEHGHVSLVPELEVGVVLRVHLDTLEEIMKISIRQDKMVDAGVDDQGRSVTGRKNPYDA